MLWADPAGTFFYVDRRAGMGSISLRPWAESSYDRPSERRAYTYGRFQDAALPGSVDPAWTVWNM